jgi:hypothetical protein
VRHDRQGRSISRGRSPPRAWIASRDRLLAAG